MRLIAAVTDSRRTRGSFAALGWPLREVILYVEIVLIF